jgi:anti-sigma factor RsiW
MDKVSPCSGLDNDALVAYLYGECEPENQQRVEAHLAACGRCAAEVEAFGSVRGSLQTWDVPRASSGIRVVSERDALRGPWWSFALRPAWGLAAAAGLVLGVGLALGGVEMRILDGGFIVQVGSPAQPGEEEAPAAAAAEAAPGLAISGVPSGAGAPWRVDLAQLESELRRDLASEQASLPPPEPEVLLEQVRGLISQSELRQQQERALWLTEFAQELDMQRSADRQQFQQELGALEGFADYLVRVSQR